MRISKTIIITLSGFSFLTFTNLPADKFKSGCVEFTIRTNIPKDITIKGRSRFDDFGDKVLFELDKTSDAVLKRTLKVDTTEFNYMSDSLFIENKRTVDVFFDPVISSEGISNSWGHYTTANARDTILLGLKCIAYDIIFTKDNIQGRLVTFNNIKMNLDIDLGGFLMRYEVTKVDTFLVHNEIDLFAKPQ
jgi:hypothetical protein